MLLYSSCRASLLPVTCQPFVPQVDARKSDEVKNAVSEAVKQFGSLTAALNCSGSIVLKPAHSTSEAEFIATLETNLHSAFFLVKHAAPVIAKAGGGHSPPAFLCANFTTFQVLSYSCHLPSPKRELPIMRQSLQQRQVQMICSTTDLYNV